jgi:hypothetical protein
MSCIVFSFVSQNCFFALWIVLQRFWVVIKVRFALLVFMASVQSLFHHR